MSKKSKRPIEADGVHALFCDEGHLHVFLLDQKDEVVASGHLDLNRGGHLVLDLLEELEGLMPAEEDHGEKWSVH